MASTQGPLSSPAETQLKAVPMLTGRWPFLYSEGAPLLVCHLWRGHPSLNQFSSVTQSCPTLCNPMDCSTGQASLSNSRSLLRLISMKSMIPSNHLILCCPLLLLPSIFPNIRVFSNKSVLRIRWPKYWSFSFSISPSNDHSGLISFRMDWLDLLAVQGTLKSLLQHHSSKAAVLGCSALFVVFLCILYISLYSSVYSL